MSSHNCKSTLDNDTLKLRNMRFRVEFEALRLVVQFVDLLESLWPLAGGVLVYSSSAIHTSGFISVIFGHGWNQSR